MKVTIECNHIGLIRIVQELEKVDIKWKNFEINPFSYNVASTVDEAFKKLSVNKKEFEERIEGIIDDIKTLNECMQPIS